MWREIVIEPDKPNWKNYSSFFTSYKATNLISINYDIILEIFSNVAYGEIFLYQTKSNLNGFLTKGFISNYMRRWIFAINWNIDKH